MYSEGWMAWGFINSRHFICSLVRPESLVVTVPVAALAGAVSNLFGFGARTVLAIFAVLFGEVIIGMMRAAMQHRLRTGNRWWQFKWFRKRKLRSWGLKVIVYAVGMWVLQSWVIEYAPGSYEYALWHGLHVSLGVWITLMYGISIYGNLSRMGRDFKEFKRMKEKAEGLIDKYT